MSKMKQYSVILNFTFEPHGCDVKVEYDDDGNEVEMKPEDKAKYDAFERTDRFYEKNDVVQYIKDRCDAYSFVQYIIGDGEVVSANWLEDKFAIQMFVDSDEPIGIINKNLVFHSLEDGEYEACGDTGWILFTRGPKDEAIGDDGKWDMSRFWEYGLTDYRQNKIIIKEIGEKPDYADESKFFSVTQEGVAFHKRIANLKMKGLKFSEDEEASFKMLCKLLNDPRMYPVN